MVPVVIQDFSRQRRTLDDGDFSKYVWSFPVPKAACDKQSFVFLSMHFHHLLYCYCSCFNFQSTKCDFAPVLSEVNSEERCVIRWPWWLLCESVFILEIQVSLAPDCIDHSFPLLTDPSHEKLSPVNGLLVVQYSMYCSIYFVLFGCGHQCFVLLTPTTPWYNEWIFLKLLVPVMLSSLSLVHPCPRESLVHIWHYKKWLAVSSSSLHTALDIDQWEG